ncbi:MAG: 1-acyl-sn-glycerol-3-phosphate acyltransferase [Rhodoferax sp.]|nr:1-acyl-sn-glycerol-3-phosphate acyltransferase [Actinomycetota bacterium]
MVELVYAPVVALCRTAFRALGMTVTVTGAERLPATGGAVLASNHVSYLDFILAGLAGVHAKRYVRFMAKQGVFDNAVAGPLMRGMKHIPVDRDAGSTSFRTALAALKRGEIVGIFPEATISRSFTVKELKSGAVRLAQASGTPLIPVTVWGGQRMCSKGVPRHLTRRGTHVLIDVGEPIPAPKGVDGDALAGQLRATLQSMLEDQQRRTPEQPRVGEDAWWHPAHLGGSAPTPDEATALDAAARRPPST